MSGVWRRVLVPSAWSLSIHAALLAVVASVTWHVATPRRAPVEAALFEDPGASSPAATIADLPMAEPAEALSFADVSGRHEPVPLASGPAAPFPTALPRATDRGAAKPTISLLVPPAAGARYAEVRAERAGRVVFLVDASGAMTTSLGFVLEELNRSVARLAPSQRFGVVVFRELPSAGGRPGPACEAFRIGSATMHAPTPAVRRALGQWLAALRPEGRSTPLDGLRAALALRPDAVFLLARSIPRSGAEPAWGPGIGPILAELDGLNPVDGRTGLRRAAIKAIQFIDDDPTGTMQAIAASHGNAPDSYRVLTIDALGRESREDAPPAQGPEVPAVLRRADEAIAELARDGLDERAMFGVLLPDERRAVLARAGEAIELLRSMPRGTDFDVSRATLAARISIILALADHRAPDVASLAAVRAELEGLRTLTMRSEALRMTLLAIAASGDSDALARLADARAALVNWGEESDDPGEAAERAVVSLELDLASLAGRPVSDAEDLAARLRAERGAPAVLLATALARSSIGRSVAPATILRPIIALADDPSFAAAREDRTAVVRALLVEVIDPSWPTEELPREAMLARAGVLERDPARTGEAAEVLVRAHDADPAAPDAPDLLWRAAAALETNVTADPGTSLAAARLLARLAIDHPRAAMAERASEAAIDRLVPLALSEREDGAESGSTLGSAGRAIRDEAAAILGHLLDARPRSGAADAGRVEHDLLRAELFVRDGTGEAIGRAAALLRGVTPAHGGGTEDRAARVLWLTDRAASHAAMGDVEAAALRADVAMVWDPDRAPRARYELARVLFAHGDAGAALEAVRAAMRDPAMAATADARLLLGEAQVGCDAPAEAMATLRPLAPSLDPRSSDPLVREAYWRCWTLMLEILAREPTSSRRDAVAAHVERLRSIDPQLGGEPWRGRILELVPR